MVNGDGTGGTATLDIASTTPAAAALYMWSLEDYQFSDSPGPAAPAFAILQWETGDPVIVGGTSVVFVLAHTEQLYQPAVATMNSAEANPPVRWRYIARPRGFNIRWRIQYSNTNLHIYQFEAWGYLWNQELAKYNPPERPQD